MKSLDISWTDDCSGKKDYDGELVSIDTRFWPSAYQKNGLCSAVCSVTLVGSDSDDERRKLAEREFEGPTFASVAAQVEAWALEQANRVERAMLGEFGLRAKKGGKS